jgi:hypothetical protein
MIQWSRNFSQRDRCVVIDAPGEPDVLKVHHLDAPIHAALFASSMPVRTTRGSDVHAAIYRSRAWLV